MCPLRATSRHRKLAVNGDSNDVFGICGQIFGHRGQYSSRKIT